ncbi:hypothetical protein OIU85_003874 [Salix viminalis]|uniref:PTC1-like winged helix-turn-helix domain-containing protein n=1 Tax=Salix viminalis TaxID=40686 RepID=A0A9Q0Q0B1_SALVM|nr:hypothetical protein OIU85_003874 [Salix viminalis]
MSQSYKGASESPESCGSGEQSTEERGMFVGDKTHWNGTMGESAGMLSSLTTIHIQGKNNPQLPSPAIKHGQTNPQLPSAIAGHGKNPQFLAAIVKEEVKNMMKLGQLSLLCCQKLRRGSIMPFRNPEKHRLYYQAEKKYVGGHEGRRGQCLRNPFPVSTANDSSVKHIGDTGLLDHLLKQIDGKVAPGGTERFCRCYNTQGKIEYWLESADLAKIKQEAGVPDPNYVPSSG